MKAAILAGGLGTRLRPITHLVPKPLIPLVGKPMIMHIIDSLPDYVDTVLLAVNYKREDLESYFSKAGIDREVILIEEDAPLGTGGALRNLMEHLDSTFLAFNGDIVSSLDGTLSIGTGSSEGSVHWHCGRCQTRPPTASSDWMGRG
jgi:mannose-1-phosphate guanylyltransferase